MKVTVVIPVKNGASTLGECLEGIFGQASGHVVEVLAVDSGSTDGTLELLRTFPVRVLTVPPEEFSHGDTRNLAASESDGDVLVFTVQDAVPADRHWLHHLVQNLERDPMVAGAFSRVLPRPGCGPLVEHGVQSDLNFGTERIEMRYDHPRAPEGWDPNTRRVRANFNNVASAVRRAVWERIPFPSTPFGEDVVWADSVLRAGYTVVFDPGAQVIHSHEYRPGSIFTRTHVDGWLNRAYFDRVCIERPSHVWIQTWRRFKADRAFLKDRVRGAGRRVRESACSLAYHFMAFTGFYLGGRLEGPRLHPIVPPAGPPRVCLAFSRVPNPEGAAAAGAAAALARGLEGAGVEARLLACGASREGEAGRPESVPDNVSLLHLDTGKDPASFRITPPASAAREAFRRLVSESGVDLLHCLDFRAPTADLLLLAREAGLPAVVTLPDFGYHCVRGDRIRPDGRPCDRRRPPGLGCLACRPGMEEFIFPLSLLDRMWEYGLSRLPERVLRLRSRRARVMERLAAAEYIFVPDRLCRRVCLDAGFPGEKVVRLPAGLPGRETGTGPSGRLAEAMRRAGGEGLLRALADPPWQHRDTGWTVRSLAVKYKQVLGRRAGAALRMHPPEGRGEGEEEGGLAPP